MQGRPVSRYRAVLFDVLGTLVELEPPWPLLRRTLERRHRIEVTEAQAKRAMVAEMAYYRSHHQEGSDEATLADLRRRCALVLQENLSPVSELGLKELTEALLDSLRFAPFPDAAPTLATLRAAGVRLGAVSNWDSSLRRVLAELGLAAALDTIVVSAEAGVGKPHPAIFRTALDQIGCDGGEALFVGDSLETDVLGARGAGIRAILLDRAASAKRDPDVERVFALADLPALVGRASS